MKNIYLSMAILSAFFLTESKAQNQEEQISALREAASRGEQIFGGIMLAQKCKTFEQSEYDAFESKAKAIVSILKKVAGQEKVNVMVQRAQVGIMTKPYTECGEEANNFVNASRAFVDKTYSILSSKENQQG